MNTKVVHVPLGTPLDHQKEVMYHLLNIVSCLYKTIDIVWSYQSCAPTKSDLDDTDVLYKFKCR